MYHRQMLLKNIFQRGSTYGHLHWFQSVRFWEISTIGRLQVFHTASIHVRGVRHACQWLHDAEDPAELHPPFPIASAKKFRDLRQYQLLQIHLWTEKKNRVPSIHP